MRLEIAGSVRLGKLRSRLRTKPGDLDGRFSPERRSNELVSGRIIERYCLRSAYRRWLGEMAALGHWETDWRGSVKARILLGSERLVERMLELLSGNRLEHTGLREKERLSLNWSRITAAIEDVWAQGWDALTTARGNGALPAAFFLGQKSAGLRLKRWANLPAVWNIRLSTRRSRDSRSA